MNDKEAIEILLTMQKKYKFTKGEREAISTAIGILSWSKLAQSGLERLGRTKRAKRKKDTK